MTTSWLFIDPTGLNLTISSESEDGPEPLTVLTYDVKCLQSILAECKRLKELYGALNFINSMK
jgi:hypothetical protein